MENLWATEFGKLARGIWKNLLQNTVVPTYCWEWYNYNLFVIERAVIEWCLVQVVEQQQQQAGELLEASRPQQSSNIDTLIMTDSRSHMIDSDPSCLTDSRPRLNDSSSHNVAPKNWAVLEAEQQSCMTESKLVFPTGSTPESVGKTSLDSVFPSDSGEAPNFPDVVERPTAAAAADDIKKTETIASSNEMDDADIDDHPLCIDLNREPSPDGDTVGEH